MERFIGIEFRKILWMGGTNAIKLLNFHIHFIHSDYVLVVSHDYVWSIFLFLLA